MSATDPSTARAAPARVSRGVSTPRGRVVDRDGLVADVSDGGVGGGGGGTRDVLRTRDENPVDAAEVGRRVRRFLPHLPEGNRRGRARGVPDVAGWRVDRGEGVRRPRRAERRAEMKKLETARIEHWECFCSFSDLGQTRTRFLDWKSIEPAAPGAGRSFALRFRSVLLGTKDGGATHRRRRVRQLQRPARRAD